MPTRDVLLRHFCKETLTIGIRSCTLISYELLVVSTVPQYYTYMNLLLMNRQCFRVCPVYNL